jgi:hypothetical protein
VLGLSTEVENSPLFLTEEVNSDEHLAHYAENVPLTIAVGTAESDASGLFLKKLIFSTLKSVAILILRQIHKLEDDLMKIDVIFVNLHETWSLRRTCTGCC